MKPIIKILLKSHQKRKDVVKKQYDASITEGTNKIY